jgi:hypothetical protein
MEVLNKSVWVVWVVWVKMGEEVKEFNKMFKFVNRIRWVKTGGSFGGNMRL